MTVVFVCSDCGTEHDVTGCRLPIAGCGCCHAIAEQMCLCGHTRATHLSFTGRCLNSGCGCNHPRPKEQNR